MANRTDSDSRRVHGASHPWTLHTFVVLAALAGLMLVLQAFPAPQDAVQSVDDAVNDFFVRNRSRAFDWLGYTLNIAGSSFVTVPLRLAIALALIVRNRLWALGAFLLAISLGEILSSSLKVAYARPRPPDPLVGVSNYAFPSGHTMAAAVISVIVVLLLVPPGHRRRTWVLGAIGITIAMGLSRVYLSAHWLSDTLAAAFLGSAVALGSALLVQALHDRYGPQDLDPGPLDRKPPEPFECRTSSGPPELL